MAHSIRKRIRQWLPLAATMLAVMVSSAQARIPEPDFVVYGKPTLFGQPVETGDKISVVLPPGTEELASYRMGSEPELGEFFALRIPMDSVDPRRPGTARPGENAQILVNGVAANTFRIGLQGHALRLDVDPGGGAPNIRIEPASFIEGTGGTTVASIPVTLSDTADATVSVNWSTQADSATGGTSCSTGIDYVSVTGATLSFPAGSLSQNLTVSLCADTEEEGDETFLIVLDNPQGANLFAGSATMTITDDDLLPDLTGFDIVVAEPDTGSNLATFDLGLSQVWPNEVVFTYQTVGLEAIDGLDFQGVAGTATIPAGSPQVTIGVPVLADAILEQNERFVLRVCDPVNARLPGPDTDPGAAFCNDLEAQIVDQSFDPILDDLDEIGNGNGTDGLLGPSAIELAVDHAYVTTSLNDSVLVFDRDDTTGLLTFNRRYDRFVSGMGDALLDGASDLVIRADGSQVYVSAAGDDAITTFSRNAVTGELAFVDALSNDGTVVGLNGVSDIAIDPGEGFLFAAGPLDSSVSVFWIDASTGRLTFAATVKDGVGGIDSIGQARAVALSPDGLHAYVAASSDSAVTAFSVDPGNGTLTLVDVDRNGVDGVRGIQAASDVMVTPDGNQVIVTGESSNAIAIFDRNPASGELTFVRDIERGDDGIAGLGGARALAMNADGASLFVAGVDDGTLSVFNRVADFVSPDYGNLFIHETRRDEERGQDLMAGINHLAISPSGQFLYATAGIDNAVLVWQILNFQRVFLNSFETAEEP